MTAPSDFIFMSIRICQVIEIITPASPERSTVTWGIAVVEWHINQYSQYDY